MKCILAVGKEYVRSIRLISILFKHLMKVGLTTVITLSIWICDTTLHDGLYDQYKRIETFKMQQWDRNDNQNDMINFEKKTEGTYSNIFLLHRPKDSQIYDKSQIRLCKKLNRS